MTKKQKNCFLILVIMCISLYSVFLGRGSVAYASSEIRDISLGCGSLAGTYYSVGGVLAKLITDSVPGMRCTAETTNGTGAANCRLVGAGKREIAFAGSMTAYKAYNGPDPEGGFKRSYKELRGLFSSYPEVYQFVVKESSDIKTIHDLKGKKIILGAPGSGTTIGATVILKKHGISLDDMDIDFVKTATAVQMFEDNRIDSFVIGSGMPTAAMVQANTSKKIRILSLDASAIEGIIKDEPYFSAFTIPANTYDGMDYPVQTVATPALIITKDDLLSVEEGYNIVKAVYEHSDYLKDAHIQGKYFTLDYALKGMCIPLHPGAAKYFKEVGLM